MLVPVVIYWVWDTTTYFHLLTNKQKIEL